MTAASASHRGLTALEPLELGFLPREGLAFDEPIPTGWIQAELIRDACTGGRSFWVTDPGHLHLEVHPIGTLRDRPPVLVKGHVKVPVGASCVRCLADVTVEVSAELMETRFPDEARASSAPSAEDSPQTSERPDLEETYHGKVIQLPEILREALLLELTLDPACTDGDACSARTHELLSGVAPPDDAGDAASDPRWAALAELAERIKPS
jgi:uncharacterized metal-binding protein YceD (DUF177 family)